MNETINRIAFDLKPRTIGFLIPSDGETLIVTGYKDHVNVKTIDNKENDYVN